jgi:hypothetical protein
MLVSAIQSVEGERGATWIRRRPRVNRLRNIHIEGVAEEGSFARDCSELIDYAPAGAGAMGAALVEARGECLVDEAGAVGAAVRHGAVGARDGHRCRHGRSRGHNSRGRHGCCGGNGADLDSPSVSGKDSKMTERWVQLPR